MGDEDPGVRYLEEGTKKRMKDIPAKGYDREETNTFSSRLLRSIIESLKKRQTVRQAETWRLFKHVRGRAVASIKRNLTWISMTDW